jgi:hypothetical protein
MPNNVFRLDSLSGCSARMGAFGHSPFVRSTTKARVSETAAAKCLEVQLLPVNAVDGKESKSKIR